ncbi:spermidine resistance protein [Savitreella phatthalungensis]
MEAPTTKEIVADWSQTGFEGPEKLLEVWFAKSTDRLPAGSNPRGLKCVPRNVWETMLDLVQCKVLSVISSPHVDAYLLSESSMFVFAHKIILKTCGTTTLLAGLQRLFEIAAEHAGFPAGAKPWRIFYSRKNYMFPDAQKAPHKTWNDEMTFLDKFFDNGTAYQIGPMNGDHWFLYMYTRPRLARRHRTNESSSDSGLDGDMSLESSIASLDSFAPAGEGADGAPLEDDADFEDETVEVLMTELSEDKCRVFYKDTYSPETVTGHSNGPMQNPSAEVDLTKSEGHLWGIAAARKSGLEQLCCEQDIRPVHFANGRRPSSTSALDPGASSLDSNATVRIGGGGRRESAPGPATMDSFLFDPLGYSGNCVRGHHYATIHVTPEQECSYASFESNFPNAHARLPQILDAFGPGKFTVTRFASRRGISWGQGHDQYASSKRLPGYVREDRIHYELDGYILEFENWRRRF